MADLPQPVTARGEATRRKLLEAAELEFGERGFHAASISSITGRAGVAQGTFYLYFPSKEEILRELVRYMSRELRRSLTEATRSCRSRLETEREGLRAFIDFSLAHENLYRVVMQSQFVDEDVYREYYRTLADAYGRGLARAQDSGELRAGDAEAQAWALMGIAHFLGLRYAIWEKREPPEAAMTTVNGFIERGLSEDGTERATRESRTTLGTSAHGTEHETSPSDADGGTRGHATERATRANGPRRGSRGDGDER